MNYTYEDYLEFLKQNYSRIRESMIIEKNSALHRIYHRAFIENYIIRDAEDITPGLVSATDSSEFVRELYNGKKIILVRALAKTSETVEKDFICEVMDVNRDQLRNFTILLMEHTEHVATIRLLEKTTPEYVLMDGSLMGRLGHKMVPIDAEGYRDFMETYFSSLYELIHKCLEREIPLIFIAKSSESLMFRNYLLDGQMADLTGSNLSTERIARRTDHLLVKSFAPEAGYTAPIRVSFNTDGSKLGTPYLNVIMFHALPDPRDLPMKIDIVISGAQGESSSRPVKYDLGSCIPDLVFWGYGGLKTHNIWLADVDREVKFRHREVEDLYMRTFERVIGVPFYETRGERRARIRV